MSPIKGSFQIVYPKKFYDSFQWPVYNYIIDEKGNRDLNLLAREEHETLTRTRGKKKIQRIPIKYPLVRVIENQLYVDVSGYPWVEPKSYYNPFLVEDLAARIASIDIDNEDKILGFIVKYGFLDNYGTINYKDPSTGSTYNYPDIGYGFEELGSIKQTISTVKLLVDIHDHLERDKLFGLVDMKKGVPSIALPRHTTDAPAVYSPRLIDEQTRNILGLMGKVDYSNRDNLRRFIQAFVLDTINAETQSVGAILTYTSNSLTRGFMARTLKNVVFYQLLSLFANESRFAKCSNPLCDAWFIQVRANQMFCTEQCGTSTRQRRHYHQHKKDERLIEFMEDKKRTPWEKRFELWNDKYPRYQYETLDLMKSDYKEAKAGLKGS